MNDKYKTKSEIIASLKEAIVIDSLSRKSEGYIYLSFKDAPFIEYRLAFELKHFSIAIEENELYYYNPNESRHIQDVEDLVKQCDNNHILHCLRFGMPFEIDYISENQTVKELWEQIEAMKEFLQTRLMVLAEIKKDFKDAFSVSLINAKIEALEDVVNNGFKTKKDLLNLNIQS